MTDTDPVGEPVSGERDAIESQALLRAISSSAAVGIGVVDRDFRIVRLNGALAAVGGAAVEELVGRSMAEVAPLLWPALEPIVRRVFETGRDVTNQELTGPSAGASSDRHWLASFHPVRRGGDGEMIGVAAVVFDVTEHRRAERFSRQLIDTSNALVLVLDADATVVDLNKAGEGITGYTREELVGRNWDLIVPRDRYPEVWDVHRRLIAEGAPQYGNPIVTKSGEERFVVWQNSRLESGGAVSGTVSFGIDVTDAVRAQQEAQQSLEQLRRVDRERRRLLERLVWAQEKERQRIARDIHDDPVQVLVALTLRLDLLAAATDDPELLSELSEARRTARAAVTSLRNLTYELHPPLLDREGLEAALRAQLEQMRQDVGVDFVLESELHRALSAQTSAIAYWIAQEALANVRKHAEARRVVVSLSERDADLVVRIADDGRGFERRHDDAEELGLASMRERAEMAGGWLRLESAPGSGTDVEFLLPGHDGDDDG